MTDSSYNTSYSVGIVAVHGAMSHKGWFEELRESLERHGILLRTIDRRGCGREPIMEGRDDSKAWVRDTIEAVADMRKRVPRVALLGWCWGARLALAAQDAGADADQVILLAPGLAMTKEVVARVKESLAGDQDPIPQPFDETDFSEEESVQRFIRDDPWKTAGQRRSFLRESKALLERARNISLSQWPSLVVLASNDRIVDNSQLSFPGSEVRTIEGGHGLVLESPDLIADILTQWLASDAARLRPS